ncbi:MAG: tryptophan 2,3-dioxygenase [Planctomycetes bacterium]|nr:tryptophan 2,3-dioxygenase [Planctomycetota bacterium]MCB9872375.1 tryptophan 2,3-dioxygenase [Planctomycetota bacterium]
MVQPKTSYWDYIKVEQLLKLQNGIAGDETELGNDEVRFIVIHQIDELWFKLVLRELGGVRDLFVQQRVPETALAQACAALHRVALMFELASQHFKLMETMRTQDYLTFRDKLSPASGFQSAQMREMEILLGLDADERLHLGYEGSFLAALASEDGESPALARVQRRIEQNASVKDAVYAWLYRTPIQGSTPDQPGDAAVIDAFLDQCLQCEQRHKHTLVGEIATRQALTEQDVARLRERYQNELDASRNYLAAAEVDDPEERARLRRIRAAILFIESNRELPLLSWPGEVIDGLVEVEQAMVVFRQRHARMVERVIGRRVGTGGSAGVEYLDQTALHYRVFKEVWAARTMLLAPEHAPHTDRPDYYGLCADG